MTIKPLCWDIYEVSTQQSQIHGVKLRGRLRKYSITKHFNLLTENATDKKNVVRFALLNEQNSADIKQFILTQVPDALIEQIIQKVKNPVLSKLKVNDTTRYTI